MSRDLTVAFATGSEFVMDGGLITDVPHRMP